jgi:ethanolamine ammonia-lyase large subunit
MLFNGANWKMNSFREQFASQSCQNEEISHLFFCSVSKFISAPAKIMKQADLVLITFASEEETFRIRFPTRRKPDSTERNLWELS